MGTFGKSGIRLIAPFQHALLYYFVAIDHQWVSGKVIILKNLFPDRSGRFLVRSSTTLASDRYRGIAIATEVDESIFDKSKKERESKKKMLGTSDPNSLLPPPPDLSDLKKKFPKIHFYSRINIIVSDSNNIRKFTQCKNLKRFDIISFQPESQNVLKSLTSVADLDIISYNPESRSTFTINRKLYNQFINQNVYFELTYAPGITDSTARRNLLSLSHTYKAVGKSKNIIVSSGAQVAAYIRGPYDIINFNLLFGLSEEQSKSSISRTCEKLLLRARKQRRSKCVMEMVQKGYSNEMAMIEDTKEDKSQTVNLK